VQLKCHVILAADYPPVDWLDEPRGVAFRPQKPLQHSAACERIVEVQLVDPPKQRRMAVLVARGR
jgi:hypothetical protein